ncbi:hypothetical protein ABKN59_006835 [Abortiporus biennis]
MGATGMNSEDTSSNARDSQKSPEQQWLRDFEFVHDERTLYVPRFTIPDLSLRSPRLPIEICESIIQSLAIPFKEEQALWNSALVCHDWLPLSRQYLYQQITFYLVSDEARVWSFFKTLKMHPHLRDFVLELVYTQMHYPNYRSEPSDPNIKDIKKLIITAKLYHQLFMHGPTLLPQLRLLYLDDVPVLNHSILSIRHPFPKVTTFIVWFTKFTSLLTLRRITQNFFPNLELLQLMEVGFLFPRTIQISTSPPEKKRIEKSLFLSHLYLDVMAPSDFPAVERWLTSNSIKGAMISSLRFLRCRSNEMSLFSSCGWNLKTLLIYWRVPDDANNISELSFGADILPVLTTLEVEFDSDSTGGLSFCHSLQLNQPSSMLSLIRLYRFPMSKDGHSLALLDDTLVSLPGLQYIEVDSESWSGLPKLREKGMIRDYTL